MTSLIAGLMLAAASGAQAPSSAPSGSTGLCKDGSYWTAPTKKGACRGHKGVQDWYATTAAPATATAAAAAPTPAAPAPAMPAPAPSSKSGATAATAATPVAPGGGPGMVWANKSSKVYHCPADRYYGKTKNGAYMTEADAKAQGFHADHGKACQ